jgi:hypothetical protein
LASTTRSRAGVQVDPLGGYPVAARVGSHQVSTPPDAIQMAPQD